MTSTTDVSALRLPPGPVDLAAIPTDATPGFTGDKAAGEAALHALGADLDELQERLFAEGTHGSDRRVLLVLQGMDTSGKGGTLEHTVGLMDPQGVRITSFKAPTKEELSHDFLWRIEKALPRRRLRRRLRPVALRGRADRPGPLAGPGRGGRAAVRRDQRVRGAPGRRGHHDHQVHAAHLRRGAEGAAAGPARRPHQALEVQPGRPRRARALWPAYREAYEIALERTNTEHAPWHVIPADRKWFRNLAIGSLLHDTLTGLDPQWPAADFDVVEQQLRLENEKPIS